jgi:hypothetical protein
MNDVWNEAVPRTAICEPVLASKRAAKNSRGRQRPAVPTMSYPTGTILIRILIE